MHILSVLLEPSTLTPTQSKGIGESLIGNMGGGGGVTKQQNLKKSLLLLSKVGFYQFRPLMRALPGSKARVVDIAKAYTVKPILSGHSKRRPKIGYQDRLSLNAGRKYCRML